MIWYFVWSLPFKTWLYAHFGTFQIIFSHHASWFRQKKLINCFTSHWQSKAKGTEKVTQIVSFQHIFSHIVTRYMQNQAKVIFIPSMSPRAIAYMTYKRYLNLKIPLRLSVSWQESRRWSTVKGISHYRANISVLSDWFCAVLERCAHRHARLWSGQWHCFGQNRLVWWEKRGNGSSVFSFFDSTKGSDMQTQIRIMVGMQTYITVTWYAFEPAQCHSICIEAQTKSFFNFF